MFDTVFGLPLHPLIVHATVVILPMAALTVALSAAWPRFRAWVGFLPLLLSVVGVILVPISTSSGEYLQHSIDETALIEAHAHLAEGLLPWVIVLAVGAAGLYVVHRQERRQGPELRPTWLRSVFIGALVVSLVGVIGTTVEVARIGHSGAKAAWSDAAA